MRVIESSGDWVLDGFKYMNLVGSTATQSSRKIGFAALSVVTGLFCAEPCAAALLYAINAISLARIASSTIFILTIAAVSLGWAFWRAYRTQRACDNGACPSARSLWLTSILLVTAFAVDVLL